MTGFCGSFKHSGEQPHHGRRQSFTVFLKPGEGLIKMSSSFVIRSWLETANYHFFIWRGIKITGYLSIKMVILVDARVRQ